MAKKARLMPTISRVIAIRERRWVEQAEAAYARFVAGWNPRGPKRARAGAANEVRR
jgi:hypothetical protein